MTNIISIYQRYKILPFLQQHQLRVAATAKQICTSLSVPVDTQGVTTAALLHDMGNILKFDFARFPEVFQPEGVEYWKDVQNEFRSAYGDDEHAATIAIAQALQVPESVLSYIRAVGFRNVAADVADPSLEKKICCYADQRVGPFGVLSIADRLREGAKRYAQHPGPNRNASHFKRSDDGLHILEQQIFARSTIMPPDITDASIAPLIKELRSEEI